MSRACPRRVSVCNVSDTLKQHFGELSVLHRLELSIRSSISIKKGD